MGPIWLVQLSCVLLLLGGVASLLWFVRGDPARGRRRCPRCWYDMAGVASLACPECGRTARSERSQRRRRRRRRWAGLGLGLLITAAAFYVADPIVRRGWGGAPVVARLVAIPWCDLTDYRFQQPLNDAIARGLPRWQQRLLARRLRAAIERDSPNPSRRTIAAVIAQQAWASGSDMRSLRPTLIALADDADPQAASAASNALGGIFLGDASMIPVWTGLLRQSPHAAVRANAAGALRGMDSLDAAASDALRAALADPDRMVVAQAAPAAGVQRVSGAAPILMELVRGPDVSVRAAALRGLRDMGPDAVGVVPDLITGLASPDDPLRGLIAEALGAIGGPARSALPALLAACDDDQPSVRGRAMIAVGRLAEPGDEQALAAIVPALDAEPTYVQRAALEALLHLQWIPSDDQRRQLESMLATPDPATRIWAKAVLLHDPSNADPLIEFLLTTLSGPGLEESAAAAEVLEALGRRAESAIPALEQYRPAEPGVFSSPDRWVRYQAARNALRAIRRDRSEP